MFRTAIEVVQCIVLAEGYMHFEVIDVYLGISWYISFVLDYMYTGIKLYAGGTIHVALLIT